MGSGPGAAPSNACWRERQLKVADIDRSRNGRGLCRRSKPARRARVGHPARAHQSAWRWHQPGSPPWRSTALRTVPMIGAMHHLADAGGRYGDIISMRSGLGHGHRPNSDRKRPHLRKAERGQCGTEPCAWAQTSGTASGQGVQRGHVAGVGHQLRPIQRPGWPGSNRRRRHSLAALACQRCCLLRLPQAHRANRPPLGRRLRCWAMLRSHSNTMSQPALRATMAASV